MTIRAVDCPILSVVRNGTCLRSPRTIRVSQFFCASCNPVTAVMRTYIHAVACISHISVRSDGNSIAREEEGIIDLLEYIPSLGAGCNRRLDVTGLTVPSAIWRTVNGKRPAGCNVISKPKFVSNY